MAFEGLTSKLQETIRKLRGKGKLSEDDIKAAMREVKLAFLEADVNYKVVKDFVKKVSEKCQGKEVLESLTPGQQVIKIVNDELTSLMGSSESKVEFASGKINSIMLTGLQGAGKTTMAGKLALSFRKKGKKPLLVACDVYRPAAIKQLQVIGKQIDIPVFTMGNKTNPVDIAKAAFEHAQKEKYDLIIFDTAGRLHIDEKLMDELLNIKTAVNPDEILLVVDAMTGQDAVNVATSFNEKLDLTGVVLTKLDGDTRGGAALSIRAMTGKPIKYVGTGEKMNDIEVFYPDRMASRILGMGDVLSLIEKAEQNIDQEKAMELSSKMINQEFNFEDYLEVMKQVKKMGPLNKIIEMIPGLNTKEFRNFDFSSSEKDMKKVESIIYSMTLKERRIPSIIMNSPSRKKRIAKGAGMQIQEVNKFLKAFENIKKSMKQMNQFQKSFRKKGAMGKFPFMR